MSVAAFNCIPLLFQCQSRKNLTTHKYGLHLIVMKTTLELPDTLFTRAKALASQRGQTMTSFVRTALEAKITSDESVAAEKPWMQFAGIHTDTAESQKIMETIDTSCGQIDPKEWQ